MPGRVLIVDDEPDVVTYLSTALHAHGYQTMAAGSAERGLELIDESRPDVICLDIMMPRESGISMYLHLKQDSTTQHIPVVIISGVAAEGQFDFRAYVADRSIPPPERYLEKPVVVNDLIATVQELIADGTKAKGTESGDG